MNTLLRNYKYRTREAALLDLLDNSVFFAKPTQFHSNNDKLEGEFVMETNASTLSNSFDEATNILAKNRGLSTGNSMKPSIEFVEMVDVENMKYIKQAKELGVFSASTTYDNQAMWSHYCKNEGLCFELEWDQKLVEERHLLISKVKYSNKPQVTNRDVILKNMLVELGNKHPEWSMNEIYNFFLSAEFRKQLVHEFIINCSCIKRECWSYEDEIRLLSPKSQNFNILNKILKSVYMFIPQFSSPNFREEIIKSRLLRIIWMQLACKYPNVNIYGLSYDKYGKLNKEEIFLREFTD